jgi:hypothetical protein
VSTGFRWSEVGREPFRWTVTCDHTTNCRAFDGDDSEVGAANSRDLVRSMRMRPLSNNCAKFVDLTGQSSASVANELRHDDSHSPFVIPDSIQGQRDHGRSHHAVIAFGDAIRADGQGGSCLEFQFTISITLGLRKQIMLNQLMKNEDGFVISAELVLVLTIAVIGMIVGLSRASAH